MGGKTFEEEFDASPSRTFAGAVRAAAELGYTIQEAKTDAGVLTFNSGRSMKSWAGQDMTVTVLPNGSGAKVIVGGSLATRGNPFGGGSQLGSWGEKKQVAFKFLGRLRQVLPSIAESTVDNTSQASVESVGLAAELQRLADLRTQGLLSEEEFQAAKSRLLG